MTDTTRDKFEAWYSGDGKYPESIKREGTAYKLIKTSLSWWAWEKATAQGKRQPLTDDHLFAVLLNIDHETKRLSPGFIEFARAIESAHGIKA